MEVQLSTAVDLDLVKMKWREQYVSEGLNRKVVPGQPPGIYQGLRIIENVASPRQVEISPDPETNHHMAVYQSTTGYSLTYWDQGGTPIILDLSDPALSNQETIIGMEMDYTVGVDTTAVWMAFPVADWDALPAARRDEIIVLGTVQVPLLISTNIVEADISFLRATYAWKNVSKGTLTWSPLLRNGDFEQAETGNEENTWYWEHRQGQYQMTLHTSATDPYRGAHCLELDYQISDDTVDGRIRQNVSVPVVPGQLIMVRAWKKVLIANTQGPEVYLEFLGGTGSLSTFMTIEIGPADAIDASYQEFIEIVEVPAGAYAIRSIQLGLDDKYQESGTTGVHVRIDDVQVYLETEGERNDLQHGVSGDLEVAGILSLRDVLAGGVGGGLYNDSSVRADYTASTNRLQFRDREFGALIVDVDGTLEANLLDGTNAHVGVDLTVDRTTILGVDQLASVSSAHVPRITAAASVFAGVEYTLMWESVPSGEKGHRLYVSPVGTAVRTVNAKWDNSTNLWTKDVNGEEASRLFQSSTTIVNSYQITGTNSWADGGWVAENPEEPGIHGDRVLMLHANSGQVVGIHYSNGHHTADEWQADANGDIIVFGVPLKAGDRIKSAKYSAFGGDAGNKGSQFRRSLLSTGVATTLESEPAQAVAGFYTRTWDIADITLTTDTLITYNWAGNHNADEFYGVAITYDHPA